MDIKKLMTFLAGGPTKRKANVAQVGNYAQEVDPEINDPLLARTLGLPDTSRAVRPVAAARDTSLDALARKAGRRVPSRTTR